MVKNLKINLQLFSEEDPKPPVFTQEQMDAAISKRLARQEAKLKTDYEAKMTALKEESAQTKKKGNEEEPKFKMPKEYVDRLDKLTADNSSLKSTLNEKAQLDAVKGANIKPEMQKFVKYEVAQSVTEGTTFNEALKTYLEANKHVLNTKGHPQGLRGETQRSKENFDNIESILKKKYPGKFRPE